MTGGYLYGAKVIDGLRERGHEVEEIIASGAAYEEQSEAARDFRLDATGYDVVVVDALARVVCSPHIGEWRKCTSVVVLVHELPGIAHPENAERERSYEDEILGGGDPSGLILTVSEDGSSLLRENGVLPERIRIVPPGFDALPKPEFEIAHSERLTALCVAQWIPRKGILELVETWRAAETGTARLLLVGETHADPEYTRLVEAGISDDDSVEVLGVVSDEELARSYAASDFFVLPSRFEGYGIVYAEALANGLPVISTEIGPLPELLRDAALFIPPKAGADALRSAIERLIEDPELRKRLSGAAHARAASLPRWSETVLSFEGVLLEAAGDGIREQNRRSWNAVVGAHESHREGLAAYLSGGGGTVFSEELGLLGEVFGRRLVHLMCNAGADTLSLAALGAEAVGVDLSDAAISRAKRLSEESGISAGFERAEVYGWLEKAARAGRRFDLALSTYGVVCWLDDLDRWARGIHGILDDGGAFVLVDFHPLSSTIGDDWRISGDYPAVGEVLELSEGVGDYVGAAAGGLSAAGFSEGVRDFRNPEPCRLHLWGLGEVLSALAGSRLRVERVEEYPYANGERHFSGMREGEGRKMYPPEGVPRLPLMYGIRATKT